MARFNELVARLKLCKVQFAPGLTEEELEQIEQAYQITFPDALRTFYRTALPVSDSFYNWRDFRLQPIIQRALNWPLEGVLFDIEYNGFWYPEWGPRPTCLADALELGRRNVLSAPTLIPVFGHRYIPCVLGMADPPVLSVYQTDIIYYGNSLDHYLRVEFGLISRETLFEDLPEIPFWSEV